MATSLRYNFWALFLVFWFFSIAAGVLILSAGLMFWLAWQYFGNGIVAFVFMSAASGLLLAYAERRSQKRRQENE